jgi:hypothetical protein
VKTLIHTILALALTPFILGGFLWRLVRLSAAHGANVCDATLEWLS